MQLCHSYEITHRLKIFCPETGKLSFEKLLTLQKVLQSDDIIYPGWENVASPAIKYFDTYRLFCCVIIPDTLRVRNKSIPVGCAIKHTYLLKTKMSLSKHYFNYL